MLLDVVYNHFGPDGSYATLFGHFFSGKHSSPWGQGVNLDDSDSHGVRNFFISNAIHWLREYHIDGLRLDATHALVDDSQQHFLAELSTAVDSIHGRKRYLIAEDERNLARLIQTRAMGGYGLDGVWADDFHHQIRNVTAGDTEAYFIDFEDTKAHNIALTLSKGWYYTGQHSKFAGAPRGTDPKGCWQHQFVHCIQNHDQVGNRPAGDRLHCQIQPSLYRAASALLLFAPATPLLFMGQEWACSSPFQFFTDHKAELGRLITEGRRREFEGFAGYEGEVPDPQDPATYLRSKLNWPEITQGEHALMHALYRDLLTIRSCLSTNPRETQIDSPGDYGLSIQRGQYLLLVSLADHQTLPLPPEYKVIFSTEDPKYSANGISPSINHMHVHFLTAAAIILQKAR